MGRTWAAVGVGRGVLLGPAELGLGREFAVKRADRRVLGGVVQLVESPLSHDAVGGLGHGAAGQVLVLLLGLFEHLSALQVLQIDHGIALRGHGYTVFGLRQPVQIVLGVLEILFQLLVE